MRTQGHGVAATDASKSPQVKPKAKGAAKRKARAKSRPPKAAKPRLARSKGAAQRQRQETRPKAAGNAAPKAKAARRPAAAKSKAECGRDGRIWMACYVYAGVGGTVTMVIRQIRAGDGEKAREIALKIPPSEEFMLTMVPHNPMNNSSVRSVSRRWRPRKTRPEPGPGPMEAAAN